MTAITNLLSDTNVLMEVGGRIRRHRLDRNLSQAALAADAAVSLPTIQRVERGDSVQWVSVLRILRGLSMLDHVDLLVPEPGVNPVALLQQKSAPRQRASGPRAERGAHREGGVNHNRGDDTRDGDTDGDPSSSSSSSSSRSSSSSSSRSSSPSPSPWRWGDES